jgi:hypothetical protein
VECGGDAVSASTRRRSLTLLTVVIALPWLACTESLSPDDPFSLEFEPVPAPSIVSGDSLRDIDGTAIPLRATAYNLRGRPIDDAQISFIVVDTAEAITLTDTDHIVATGSGRGTVRIIAATGALQSAPRVIEIVPAPSAAERVGPPDTLRYSFSNPSLNTSDALEVKVTWDSANAPVPMYVVGFRLDDFTDTLVARLVDDGGRRSPTDPSGATFIDTTETSGTTAGIAGRRIRLTPSVSLLQAPFDSIVVLADVRLRGEHVAGSPVRLVLVVTPRTTTAP